VFLSHNFGYRYARNPIKGSKVTDFSQVLKQNLGKKMACWVGAQGQIKVAKNSKTSPLLMSTTENPKHKIEKFVQLKLTDFSNP